MDCKKRNHSKVTYDICETEIYFKNMEHHIKGVHAGFNPRSTLAWMQMKQEKKDQYKYFCELCSKYFYDKSTPNKHIEIIVISVTNATKYVNRKIV